MIDYIYPRTVDWVRVLEDLPEHGMTYSAACRQLGVAWSTLTKWRHGSEPGWSKGSAVLQLHAKVCGAELTKQRIQEASIGD